MSEDARGQHAQRSARQSLPPPSSSSSVEPTLTAPSSYLDPSVLAAYQDLTDAIPKHPGSNNVSSHRRTRELYQYFQPASFETSWSTAGENVLLATQAQLVAIRLGGKCLINFLDDAKQYIVAEEEDDSMLDAEVRNAASLEPHNTDETSPGKWFECRAGSRDGSICNYTINLPETDNDDLPFFEVTDLAQDPRFSDTPIVTQGPRLRYYAGTPLYTKSGIAIGALIVIDKKPRPPKTRSQQKFMKIIAQNIVSILELHKDSRQQHKTTSMNRCLSRFVDPLHQSSQSGPVSLPTSPDLPSVSGPPRVRAKSGARAAIKEERAPSTSAAVGETLIRSNSKDWSDKDSDKASIEDNLALAPFPEAAELLREALGADTCGVVFLDTVSISFPTNDPQSSTCDATRSSFQSQGASPVLAYSFNPAQAWPQPNIDPRRRLSTPLSFLPLPTDSLISLAERYPSGQLWTFDGQGDPCYDVALFDSKGKHLLDAARWGEDGLLLLHHFPQASCIFLKPIWNARSHRMVVALVYSSSLHQSFTAEHDVPFINAFCNCVTVDLVRLAALAANRQKGDFIGSISHELRSPLHGILASCDLLEDTVLAASQQSLVETANSCARTLLDTISMVLDYSKINAFERDFRKVKSNKRSMSTTSVIKADPNRQGQLLPNLYGNVDLASVVEEVVEGAVIGQGFQSLVQDVDFADLGAQARGRHAKDRRVEKATKPAVEVFVDIQRARKDWVYVTQPGAFRRCIMNLVGNSLKYTTAGWVRIALQVTDTPTPGSPSDDLRETITLTVEDTGKGISQEYLQTKLFSPFAQENILAPGTGLGLSLTKSIIDMLEGEIHIESTVGQGTKVSINIPMLPRDVAFRQNPSSSEHTTPSTAGTGSSDSDAYMKTVKDLSHGRRVGYFSIDADSSPNSERVHMMQLCLETYMRAWFEIDLVEDWKTAASDLLMVNDFDLPALLERLESSGSDYPQAILVFCTNASQFTGPSLNLPGRTCEFHALSKPFGPHRLARCLQACFKPIDSPSEASQSSAGTVEARPADIAAQNDISPTFRHDLTSWHARADITYNENSLNASLALGTPLSTPSTLQPLSTSPATSLDEFPFPGQGYDAPKVTFSQSAVEPARDAQETIAGRTSRSQTLQGMDRTESVGPAPSTVKRSPRLLLVDDNNINLKLLSTYMKKLKYTDVSTATDGRQAVDHFKAALDTSSPPAVIFMDLSMPVLDGFDATREIRALEKAHHAVLPALVTPSSALIIALTGLASQADQELAFEAGVDLYMTKPASFKEVGTLLQTWEANGGVEASEGMPHGAVAGEMPVMEGKRE